MTRTGVLLAGAFVLGGCHNQATYAEGCGALPANWITPRQGRGVMSLLNVVSVYSNGTISWNRAKVSEATLTSYLKQVRTLNPLPVTQIKFESDVDCGTVVRVRRLMLETLDCRYGACAEGRGRWWLVGDVGPPFEAYDPQPNLPQEQ